MPGKKQAKNTSSVKSSTLLSRRRVPLVVVLFAVLLIAIGGGYAISRSFADSSTLYLSPANTTINIGDTFSVAVRLNPVSNVDGVEATLAYDPSVLEFQAIDTTSSAFPTSLVGTGSAGTVSIARGIFAPAVVKTDALVANVSFKALAAASSTVLKLSGNSTYLGSYLNPGTVGGSVVVNAVITPPPPPSDTTPPAVTITNPANGATLKSKSTITATATDNSGTVSKTELYIDGGIIQTNTTGSLSYSLNTKSSHLSKGAHTITVKAYDPSGNIGNASVSVKL